MSQEHLEPERGTIVATVEGEELEQLLALKCLFYGAVDPGSGTITLVNRCNQCMKGTIFWTPWQGQSVVRTYEVPPLSAIKVASEGQSSSLIAENAC